MIKLKPLLIAAGYGGLSGMLTAAVLAAMEALSALLWQGEPGATYRLAYGNRDVPAPAFDLAPLRAALQSGATTIAWELAAPSADEWPPAVPRSPGFTRALLIGALMVAAALALAAYRIKRGA